MDNLKVINARTLFVGDGSAPFRDQAVVVSGMKIVDVVPIGQAPKASATVDTEILAPGFIDLQLNGAGGRQFNDDPTVETLNCMAKAAQIGGTAWFFPTFITDHERKYHQAIAAVEMAHDKITGVKGLHLEGPFLSPERPGIHPPAAIRKMDDEDEGIIAAADITILLTLAPEETDCERLRRLNAKGVRLFAGHSEADYEMLVQAQSNGIRGATHLFNAMSQMQNREPGLVGAVLDRKELFAGIIADGIHVHEANLRTAFSLMGPDRLFLVTDAMKPLGTGMTEFDLLGRRIFRKDGYLASESGILAGADISMIDTIQALMRFTSCDPSRAIQMATQTPACAVGLENEIGTISAGKQAGFTHLGDDFSVKEIIYGTSPIPS